VAINKTRIERKSFVVLTLVEKNMRKQGTCSYNPWALTSWQS